MDKYQYGINIETLDKFISKPKIEEKDFGSKSVLIEIPEFKLERLVLLKDKEAVLKTENLEAALFVESGELFLKDINLGVHEVVILPPNSEITIIAKKDSVIYLFSGHGENSSYYVKQKPFDYREKYWGNIQTIVSGDYVGKRIFVNKGKNASLEFHCQKIESYYIHSGKLLLRLRAGRGEDRFFNLEEGKTAFTSPGLMHQRGGLEDTVIIEISTRDSDSDSFLVEDGEKIHMPNLIS